MPETPAFTLRCGRHDTALERDRVRRRRVYRPATAVLVGSQVVTGRLPHLTYRPERMDVTLDDVIGIDPVLEDVRRSIDVFETHRRSAEQMGGSPRRGLLFEGPPGTGKTLTAKKIRSYFAALRKAARAEGGAIGFIEEIDAIATVRGGCPRRRAARGDGRTGVARSRAWRRRSCVTRWSARAPGAWSTSCSCGCSRSTSRRARTDD